MTPSSHAIVEIKNQWLWSQVDVEYPTPESLKGRALYQAHTASRQVQPFASQPQDSAALDDIFLVDFHRLTIMFALLQAAQMETEAEQNLLVEFFTQIIFSEPCSLYVGFENSQPVAAAIVTAHDDNVLVSDIALNTNQTYADASQFAAAVLAKWCQAHAFDGEAFLEV